MSLPYQDMFDASVVGISKKERMLEHRGASLIFKGCCNSLFLCFENILEIDHP